MSQLIVTINGDQVHDYSGFIQEFNRAFSGCSADWDGNLDAFNDYLVWPEGAYVLIWKDSEVSRRALSYEEMSKWLEERLQACHPSNRQQIRQWLEAAKDGQGPTMFDTLIEIIGVNTGYVELKLE